MEIQIREYSDADVSYIKLSFEKLHDYVISIDPIKRIRKMPRYIDVFFNKFLINIKNNQGKIFIAEDNEKPIGFIAGFIADKQSEENLLEVIPSQLGIVSDVYIEKEFRGKNIGKMLMEAIEKYLVDKKCDALWVDTNEFNTHALHLYKSVGYTAREIGLIKKL